MAGLDLGLTWLDPAIGHPHQFANAGAGSQGQHVALDALAVGTGSKAVNWILDVDIRGSFDNISHYWMMRFVDHRVGDRRVLRLIRGWLKAGVVESGARQPAAKGTPQGAVISAPASAGACICWRTFIFTTPTICGPPNGGSAHAIPGHRCGFPEDRHEENGNASPPAKL